MIHIIEQLSRNRVEKALPDSMKMAHFGVLSFLKNTEGCHSPAKIAEIFQVTRPSMTNTLQRLEARGYIDISADPHDGRGKRVALTSRGSEAHTQALEAIAPFFSDIVEALGTGLFSNLLPALTRVKTYLDENRQQSPE